MEAQKAQDQKKASSIELMETQKGSGTEECVIHLAHGGTKWS
jgi:hypothetical protein